LILSKISICFLQLEFIFNSVKNINFIIVKVYHPRNKWSIATKSKFEVQKCVSLIVEHSDWGIISNKKFEQHKNQLFGRKTGME
jgi:hypothetical protein